ncbi:MAG: SMP-30/gluconolactonase/LRE family protein [Bacteroidota bacterium]
MMKIFCLLLVVFLPFIAAAQSPIPPGAKLDTVVSGLSQLEGPVWKDGLGLLFSDIARSRIYLWSPSDSSITIYLYPSDSSNGLTLDAQGRLILTQMQKRRVSRQESNGTITPLASTFRGKKFNSPNDLVVKSDGSIFFTDPDFNIPAGQTKELSFKGVYRISPSGTVALLDSVFDKPNGLCFSPDETQFYVNESPQGKIYAWDVVNDSIITNKRLLYTIPLGGYSDGMKVDPEGNIYCTGPTGVWIISPDGEYLDKIATPPNHNPSNCTWGDTDRKTLYITTGNATPGSGFIYRIRLASGTGIENHGSVIPDKFELYANYPNPFNPNTQIEYGLQEAAHVNLTIYNIKGQKVETLIDGDRNAGIHKLTWNSSSVQGKEIAGGIYLLRLQAGESQKIQKLVLLK